MKHSSSRSGFISQFSELLGQHHCALVFCFGALAFCFGALRVLLRRAGADSRYALLLWE